MALLTERPSPGSKGKTCSCNARDLSQRDVAALPRLLTKQSAHAHGSGRDSSSSAAGASLAQEEDARRAEETQSVD